MDETSLLRLHRFPGGLPLPGRKAESTAQPIGDCPLPEVLRLALCSPQGETLVPRVVAGQRVRRGELLAEPGIRGACLHAPADGVIVDAGDDCLRLRVAATQAAPRQLPRLDPASESPERLRARIAEAGVVGLGGAGFPTADKLARGDGASLLIVNGAECEPWVACDDALLREQADTVLHGAALLARILQARRTVVAVEDRMVEAWAALRRAQAALQLPLIELVAVPTVYPAGGERQLIEVLTGRQVPRGGLPHDIGVLVHNVGTAVAAWRAVTQGEVLTHRIVTVTGAGVARPGNFRAAVGTPVAHLVEQAGGYTPGAARLLLGGPMTGEALANDEVGIDKRHNCVLVLAGNELRDPGPAMPCIRCGDCARACPARLQPQQLHWHLLAGHLDRADANGVFDCIECGCCDLVCPSHITLVQQFRDGKTALRVRSRKALAANAARERFEARNARRTREDSERAERESERKQRSASADAVAAAIERAKAKRQSAKDGEP